MKTPTVERRTQSQLLFHPHAYVFVQEALKTAQEMFGRPVSSDRTDDHHISVQELLEGIRMLGLRRYGLMAPVVFGHWGLDTTDDFGRAVFELFELGEMRKSDRDQLSDFHNVYTFGDDFGKEYQIDVTKAFRSP